MLSYALAKCGPRRVRLIVSGDDTVTVLASAELDLTGLTPPQAATALIRDADTDAARRDHDLTAHGGAWRVEPGWTRPILDARSLHDALRVALVALRKSEVAA